MDADDAELMSPWYTDPFVLIECTIVVVVAATLIMLGVVLVRHFCRR
jgi:hypothetical protein